MTNSVNNELQNCKNANYLSLNHSESSLKTILRNQAL